MGNQLRINMREKKGRKIPSGMRALVTQLFQGAGLTGEFDLPNGFKVSTSGSRKGLENVTVMIIPGSANSFKLTAQSGGNNTRREYVVYCKDGAPTAFEAVEIIEAYLSSLHEPRDTSSPFVEDEAPATVPATDTSKNEVPDGGTLAEIRKEFAKATSLLEGHDHKIVEKEQELAKVESGIPGKKRSLVDLRSSLESVTSEMKPVEDLLGEIRKELARLQQEQAELEQQLDEIRGRRVTIEGAVKGRDREVSSAASRAKRLRRELDLLASKRDQLQSDVDGYAEMLQEEEKRVFNTRAKMATEGLERPEDIEALIAQLQAQKARMERQ